MTVAPRRYPWRSKGGHESGGDEKAGHATAVFEEAAPSQIGGWKEMAIGTVGGPWTRCGARRDPTSFPL
jgi:hypothetical protein